MDIEDFIDFVLDNGLKVALIAMCVLVVGIGAAPKNVDYYYISGHAAANVVCANAHWTWHLDEQAYCSDDKDKVLDFVTKANATIVKH